MNSVSKTPPQISLSFYDKVEGARALFRLTAVKKETRRKLHRYAQYRSIHPVSLDLAS